jgi:Pregnancy-associated plasma protein-A.
MLSSKAQTCGSDAVHAKRMATDPAYAASYNAGVYQWINQPRTSSLLVTLPNGKTAYEIPVVVHVMYPANAPQYDKTNAQIQSVIDYMNQSFQATWAGYPQDGSGGTRIPIVFKLAARNPSCAATTGVNHIPVPVNLDPDFTSDGVNVESTAPALGTQNFETIQDLSRWPITEYYNIWVVHKLDGNDGTSGSFIAGYANYSSNPASDYEGTVMLSTQMAPNRITLVHELGHAFNLRHTFDAGGCAGPVPSAPNCNSAGDLVCDTWPTTATVGSCPTTMCTNPNNPTVKNFMNYSNCQDHFTPGQRDRAMFTLFEALNTDRAFLLTSLGATAPGTPAVTAPTCITTTGNPGNIQNRGVRYITIWENGVSPMPANKAVFKHRSGGYNDEGNAAYVDNTCKHQITLVPGNTYSMRVTATFGEHIKAFIDYNNDGIFQSSERILAGLHQIPNGTTTNFTVPVTGAVYCQPLRMRVVSDAGINTDSCNVLAFGQAEDYRVILQGAGGGGGTTITGQVTLNSPTYGNPSCLGTGNEVTANLPTGITPVWYGWYRKSTTNVISQPVAPPDVISITSWSSSSFLNWDTVYLKVAIPGVCGVDTLLSDSMVMYRPATIPPSVTIGVITGTNPTCLGEPFVIGVTGNSNPGGAPTYQWKVNNINQGPNGTASTFDASTLNAGDVVSVVMTSSASTPCAQPPKTATSNNITLLPFAQRAPTFQIALTQGTNPGCANQVLTFTAINITTGGTNPTFQWKVNNIVQPGFTGTTFSGIFNNGDVITATMTSTSACASPAVVNNSGTSPVIQHTQLTADISIAQLSGGNPACKGKPVLYQATTTNAGANPQFQWMINNLAVPNATGQLFQTTSLLNNDFVTCVLIATDPCVANTLDTSNQIIMGVTPSLVPTVAFTITDGNNPGCLDSLLEFTATSTNIGANPNYDWFVNGFGPVLNGNVFSTTNLLNGDVVTVRANQTDNACYLPDTVYSAPLIAVRSLTPDPPIISLINNMLVTNKNGAFVWFGPGITVTDTLLAGGEDGRYHPTQQGKYYAKTNNNGCWSKPSNILTITLLDVNNIVAEAPRLYPNPTTGQVKLSWGHNVTMGIVVNNMLGQKLMETSIKNQHDVTLDLGQFANGVYSVVTTDENGNSATQKVTVSK